MKKIFFIILIIFCFKSADASDLLLKPSSNIVGLGEQFYIDILIDTQGDSINGISGSFYFDQDKLNFIRTENGKSMVDFWVENKQEGNKIIFSGIMSSGFSGVIDPFNSKTKLPGSILRLVFEPKKDGLANLNTSDLSVSLSDGLGTLKDIENKNIKIEIQDIVNVYNYKNQEISNPSIEAYITKDNNIFNNKYVIIFRAEDKSSGIKEVLIKEGLRSWKKIESPYVLEDQSRRSIIALQAINYNGVSVVTSFEPIPYNMFSFVNIILFIFVLLFVLIIFKNFYERKNKKNL